jgi:hypothetical protein
MNGPHQQSKQECTAMWVTARTKLACHAFCDAQPTAERVLLSVLLMFPPRTNNALLTFAKQDLLVL